VTIYNTTRKFKGFQFSIYSHQRLQKIPKKFVKFKTPQQKNGFKVTN